MTYGPELLHILTGFGPLPQDSSLDAGWADPLSPKEASLPKRPSAASAYDRLATHRPNSTAPTRSAPFLH